MEFLLVGAGGETGRALARLLSAAGYSVTLADDTWLSNARASDFKGIDGGHVICLAQCEASIKELLEKLRFGHFLLVHRPGAEKSPFVSEIADLTQVTTSPVIAFNPGGDDVLTTVIESAVENQNCGKIVPAPYISAEELAKALCAIALKGANKHYHIAGPDILSADDVARALKAVTRMELRIEGEAGDKDCPASTYDAEFGAIPSHGAAALREVIGKHLLLRKALSPNSRGKTTICERDGTLTYRDAESDGELVLPLGTPAAFEIASKAWLRAGWDVKHHYSFSWLGRPVIQLPEDLVRMQELIASIRPDVIIETGIAHGGSLIFYASLMEAMDHGRVIGIDIEIRAHNRAAIEDHRMFKRIDLIEGSSTASATVEQVRDMVKGDETVLVILDSDHSKAHVLDELRAYGPMVSPGSYIIATDGIMAQVAGGPRTGKDWSWNNPSQAALEFVAEHSDFILETPPFPFNESYVHNPVTHYPFGTIKRIR